ncbi:toxic anion resistance protein [Catonella massiliensis]|uniref:Toxic anion resistance protein n=1 Tax=Catonella massiliensis TaxID=2799636 RepID=A0ABS1J0C9_9FIRM|nr:toxic anion resistance protein [Catonella massiliensis]MBK5897601.1 toxic anion resistance protein [Catonella massiliensis]
MNENENVMPELAADAKNVAAPTLTLEQETAPAPSLTLEPAKAENQLVVDNANDPIGVDENILSDAEKKQVEDFAKQINIKDSNVVLQYGSGAQKKMADFSEKAIGNVKTKDMGEVGKLLSDVVIELKNFNEDDEKGIFGFFKKQTNKLQVLKTKYDKAEVNIGKITDALESHQVTLMKDTAMLDQMYELNLTHFKELTMYIIAGKKRLYEVRNTELKELQEKAAASGKPEDAQAVRDLDAQCTRFEKKLYDLELTRTVAMQTAPQIRLVQENDIVMSEKIQSTLVNTIPLWKTQMALALGIEHAGQAAKAEREVNDMTNQLLTKNAEMLHQASVDVAKESERGIVDIETLTKTNETLINTFDEVMQIQKEGREKRAAAEVEMARIEAELKNKVLSLTQNN